MCYDLNMDFYHAYMTDNMVSCATYARADGTLVKIAMVEKGERRPEPLPKGWTYLGEVVRYVSGQCVTRGHEERPKIMQLRDFENSLRKK